MKLLFFLLFFWVSLQANCTQEQKIQAQTLYAKTEQSQSKKEQIELLYQALNSCYSAEIEANYLILKAEESSEVNQKIGYYKKALLSLSLFQDKELLLKHQDTLNLILSRLYEPIDKEVAKLYRSKVRGGGDNEDSEVFLYGVYSFISLFLFWSIFYLVKKP